jgi:hypothetical protein
MKRITKRLAVPVGAAILLGSTGFAFMAANSVPETFAGNGSGPISGYVVSDVHYELVPDAFAPVVPGQESIQRVYFTLNHPATTVRAYVNDRMFKDCAQTDNFRWRCTPENAGFGVLTEEANTLHVVAAQ